MHTHQSLQDEVHIFWHDACLQHVNGYGVFDAQPSPFLEVPEPHPENANRLRNMRSLLQKGPLSAHIQFHGGRPADSSELLTWHTQDYVKELEHTKELKELASGTLIGPGSWQSILAAAGTTLMAMQYLLEGKAKVVYALVRPPGHHAQPDRADGCWPFSASQKQLQSLLPSSLLTSIRERPLLANVTWHLKHLQCSNQPKEAGRCWRPCLPIADTAAGFSASLPLQNVIHQGTFEGHAEERGKGAGNGYNLNVPLPMGTGDQGYLYAMEKLVEPAVEAFQPDLLVIPLGVDGSQFDPNGRQCLTMPGFRALGRSLRKLADKHCQGRLCLVQEGGYSLSYSAFCVQAVLEGILNLESLGADPLGYYPEDPTVAMAAVDMMIAKLDQTRE